MPIRTRYAFNRISDDRFDQLDYELMGRAYEMQNEFGKLFCERAYQQEMADRLVDQTRCDLEEKIVVAHKCFSKTISLDMVLEQSMVLELKVTKAITLEHRTQLLQYLMLCGVERGKIINFGESKVKAEWVTTRLKHESRRELTFDDRRWVAGVFQSDSFKKLMIELLNDLGGFLSLPLYYEAITCLLRGEVDVAQVIKPIPVMGSKRYLCLQNCHLLNPTTAFKITSLTSAKACDANRAQLQKFLARTQLTKIQWVNLNHHNVVFESVKK